MFGAHYVVGPSVCLTHTHTQTLSAFFKETFSSWLKIRSCATHLPGDDCYLGDCGLCVRIQQFGSVSDDASVLLSRTCLESSDARVTACDWSTVGIAVSKNTWKEARHIHKSDDGDVEGVTEANKSGSLHGRVDVQTA